MQPFAKHLIDRYGLDEVSQWYFEVWNEPNIDFWAGDPKQANLLGTVRSHCGGLEGGQPAAARGGPPPRNQRGSMHFIQHCADKHVPVDFVSTHVYGNDSAKDVFGTHERNPAQQDGLPRGEKSARTDQRLAVPNMPLIWSEFNASYMNEPAVTDSPTWGPGWRDTIRRLRRPGGYDVVLDFLRRVRRTRRGENAVLWRVWADR